MRIARQIVVPYAPNHVAPEWPGGQQQQQLHLDLQVDDVAAPAEPVLRPASRAQWRAWLECHHADVDAAWVEYPKVRSGQPASLRYVDLVEEALCFGWIDGRARPVDATHTSVRMSRRRPGGTWAASNKERVERLAAAGLMAPAGLAAVERARADGSWNALDAVDNLVLPEDLATALAPHPGARERFEALSPSARRAIIWAVISAKRPETRAGRVRRIVAGALAGLKPEEWLRP